MLKKGLVILIAVLIILAIIGLLLPRNTAQPASASQALSIQPARGIKVSSLPRLRRSYFRTDHRCAI